MLEGGGKESVDGFPCTQEARGEGVSCLFVSKSLNSWENQERSRFGGLESGKRLRVVMDCLKWRGGADCGLGVWRLGCGRDFNLRSEECSEDVMPRDGRKAEAEQCLGRGRGEWKSGESGSVVDAVRLKSVPGKQG